MKSLHKLLALHFETFDSRLEKHVVIHLLDYSGLNWIINHPVGPYRLDIAFPEYMVGLEIDGHDFHTSDKQVLHDTERDEWLTSKGWTIERVPGWFAYRYPKASLLKALRHIPKSRNQEAFKEAVGELVEWQTTSNIGS
jgi:very-short-patch-repair endonuclease